MVVERERCGMIKAFETKCVSEGNRQANAPWNHSEGIASGDLSAVWFDEREFAYIYSDDFDRCEMSDEIMRDFQTPEAAAKELEKLLKPTINVPFYMRALYGIPLLNREKEQHVFRKYNYLKYKACKLRDSVDPNDVNWSIVDRANELLVQAKEIKDYIIEANLRLVVSIAKKHVTGSVTLYELVSDGNTSLMRAVEKFDYSRGFRFSTYASWAIMRSFGRTVPRERRQMDRFHTGCDETLETAAGMRAYDPNNENPYELRESLDFALSRLSEMERVIVLDHFGLKTEGQTKTLAEMAGELGFSRERVRQIELQALKKLRHVMLREERRIGA